MGNVNVYDDGAVSTNPCDAALKDVVAVIDKQLVGVSDPAARYAKLSSLALAAIDRLTQEGVCPEERLHAIRRLVHTLRPTVLFALVWSRTGVQPQPVATFEGPDWGTVILFPDVPEAMGLWITENVRWARQLFRQDVRLYNKHFAIQSSLDVARPPPLGPNNSLFAGVLSGLSRNARGYLVLQRRDAGVHCLVFADDEGEDADTHWMSRTLHGMDTRFLQNALSSALETLTKFWSKPEQDTQGISPEWLTIIRPKSSMRWFLDDDGEHWIDIA